MYVSMCVLVLMMTMFHTFVLLQLTVRHLVKYESEHIPDNYEYKPPKEVDFSNPVCVFVCALPSLHDACQYHP